MGNGTQASFYTDPNALYVSAHQYPFYPGTGAAGEVGAGPGEGRTVNVPLAAGCDDDEYVHVFTSLIEPIAMQFRPEVVLISAGFDAHRRDPLAGMGVTDAGFRAMTRVLLRVAEAQAGRAPRGGPRGWVRYGGAPDVDPSGHRRARRSEPGRTIGHACAADGRARGRGSRAAVVLGSVESSALLERFFDDAAVVFRCANGAVLRITEFALEAATKACAVGLVVELLEAEAFRAVVVAREIVVG